MTEPNNGRILPKIITPQQRIYGLMQTLQFLDGAPAGNVMVRRAKLEELVQRLVQLEALTNNLIVVVVAGGQSPPDGVDPEQYAAGVQARYQQLVGELHAFVGACFIEQ